MQFMSITSKREHLIKHLISELGRNNVKAFSESLKYLDICDLTLDSDLDKVTTNGYIDTLIVLYNFGTINKIVQVKKSIKEQ